MTSTIGNEKPFRYRGYYYDDESGFYYLNSRYYDPEVCRFISQDSYISTGQGFAGFNMYAYCLDNPVNFVDYSGTDAFVIGGVWYALSAAAAAAGGFLVTVALPAVAIGTVLGVGTYGIYNAYNEYKASQSVSEPDDAEKSVSADVASTSGGDIEPPQNDKDNNGIPSKGNGKTSNNPNQNNKGIRFDPNQQAIIQMAKEAVRNGLSKESGEILWEWVEEYGLSHWSNFYPIMSDRFMNGHLHLKINGLHIKIF